MELEIISRYPTPATGTAPVVFIHGAFCGAWVWDEHFLPYFAAKGYEAHALSLRGHGASPGGERPSQTSLGDYVDDLRTVVSSLRSPPVLIGHSLGGVVVQRYLRHHDAAAAVLMASGPPHGMLAPGIGMFFRNPLLVQQIFLLQTLGPKMVIPDLMANAVFSSDLPRAQALAYLRRMQAEVQSFRSTLDLLTPSLPLPMHGRHPPLLVLGAERDFFISPFIVRATARFLGTRAWVFPSMGHAMMLEPGWQEVADHILDWLNEKLGAGSESRSGAGKPA